MLRPTFRWLGAVACAVLGSFNFSAYAIDPPGTMCSVEKLRAMLQTIDPYKPEHTIAGEIPVFGSATMDGLAHAWIDNFREFHPDIKFQVSGLSEAESIKRLIAKPSGIWLVSRPVKPEELGSLKSNGLRNPVSFEVARQALAVYVHQSNPVTSITGEQLRAIFTTAGGDAPTWKLLGVTGTLADQPIKIISRSQDSGTYKFLAEMVFRSPLRSGSMVKSNAEVVDAIKDEPLAIGISNLRCGITDARSLNLKAGNIEIPSDEIAIVSGQYPLVRPLTVVFDMGNPESLRTTEFLRYVLSQSGQAENVLAGYYPVDLPLIHAELARLASTDVR